MREDQWLKFTPLTNKQGRRKMVQIGRHGPIKEAYDAIMNTFRFHCKWEMGFIRCICSGITFFICQFFFFNLFRKVSN